VWPNLFLSPDVARYITEERVRNTLRKAERARWLREARLARPRRRDQVLASIGRLLVAIGEKLQGQNAPAGHERLASEMLRQPPVETC